MSSEWRKFDFMDFKVPTRQFVGKDSGSLKLILYINGI